MKYENVCRAVFLERMNRFVAQVELDGKTETVHVKNTGRLRELLVFWERAAKGGRKSFRYDELDPSYVIPQHKSILVPYLDMINQDLSGREDEA